MSKTHDTTSSTLHPAAARRTLTSAKGMAAILCLASTLAFFGCAEDANNPYAYLKDGNALSTADELAIRQILARMNHAVDTQQWDTYLDFYAADAVFDTGIAGVAEGHDDMLALLEMMAPYISTKRHLATNIVITGEGDRATTVSYLTIFEREAELRLDGTAVVTDEFVRQPDGAWLIVHHMTSPDPATIPDESGQ